MDKKLLMNGAVGSFKDYCAGYLNPGASGLGYIAALKLSVGKVTSDMDEGLENIVSYDSAEASDAYVGQINMLTASSFCGLNGLIWGYDVCRHKNFQSEKHLYKYITRHDGYKIPIRKVEPLLDAAQKLFGQHNNRRFPPLPGAMIICANKSITKRGPAQLWCAIALAIPEDRSKNACMFIEDAGYDHDDLENIDMNIAKSIIRCGENQSILFKEIYVGHKTITITENEVGCALTCAPYVTLAQNAIPQDLMPEKLLEMNLDEWEKSLNLKPLEI